MVYANIELEHYNHKVGINFWHMNWQTKYRYKMFAKFEYKNLAEACLRYPQGHLWSRGGHFKNKLYSLEKTAPQCGHWTYLSL